METENTNGNRQTVSCAPVHRAQHHYRNDTIDKIEKYSPKTKIKIQKKLCGVHLAQANKNNSEITVK